MQEEARKKGRQVKEDEDRRMYCEKEDKRKVKRRWRVRKL